MTPGIYYWLGGVAVVVLLMLLGQRADYYRDHPRDPTPKEKP